MWYFLKKMLCGAKWLRTAKNESKIEPVKNHFTTIFSENSLPSLILTLIRYKPGVRLETLMEGRDARPCVSTMRRPSRE